MVLQHTADNGFDGSDEQGAAPREGFAVPLGRKHVEWTREGVRKRMVRRRGEVVGRRDDGRIVSRVQTCKTKLN